MGRGRGPVNGVWILSELYYPEETSTGYLLTRIAEGLAREFRVGAICGQPTYALRGVRAARTEDHGGVVIRRCRGTTLDRTFFPFRLLNMITLGAALWLTALRCVRRNDWMVVVTNPPLLPFIAGTIAVLKRARLLILVHDMYPEVLVASGVLSPNSLVTRLWNGARRWLYASAERVVVLGRDMQNLVRMRVGEIARVTIIPNWADLDQVRPVPREDNALLQERGLQQHFVVQYAGNMGLTHDIETLIDACDELRSDPDVHFLFIGNGGKRAWLEAAVEARGLRGVTVLPERRRSDQPNFLNACDVAVVSFVPGMAGISVPSRMYNILAAGKPIIALADGDSELALMIREHGVGWVLPSGDVAGLVKVVREARQQPELVAEMARRAREVAESCRLDEVIRAYAGVLREPARRRRAAERDP